MNTIVKLQEDADAVLNMPSDELGEKVYDNTVSPNSGSFDEIGDDLRSLIREAKTGAMDPLEAIEKTLIAITGSGFAATAGVGKDQRETIADDGRTPVALAV